MPNQISAKVNGRHEFLPADLEPAPGDIQPIGPNEYRVRVGARLLEVSLIGFDARRKTCRCRIDGSIYEVAMQTPLLRRIEQLGLAKGNTLAGGDVNAPMPGLVREIMVAEGEHVAAEQPILILEAMKMENVIKSKGAGIVSKIAVSAGDAVEKGTLLIALAPPENE